MQTNINILHKAAVTLIAMILATGCVFEKDNPSDSGKRRDVMVMLDVNVSDMVRTKAVIDGGELAADAQESVINTVRVFAYNQSGVLVGYADDSNRTTEGTFHMVLSVPEGATAETVDFYVIANEASMMLPEGTFYKNMTIAELKSLKYNDMSLSLGIPMYGVVEDKVLTLNNGTIHNTVQGGHDIGMDVFTESIEVGLGRSLAKVGVYAAAIEGASSPVINKVTFFGEGCFFNSYLLPPSSELLAAVPSSEDHVFLGEGNEFEVTTLMHENAPASIRNDVSNYDEVLSPKYFAENVAGSDTWDVPSAGDRPMVMQIEYSFGTGTEKRYASVNMPQILRNHYYQILCLINTEGEIRITVNVADWSTGDDWVLTFDHPSYSNPLFASSTFDKVSGLHSEHTVQNATMYYSAENVGGTMVPTEEGAFSVDFRMTYPVGQKWTPTLDGTVATDYKIKVYRRGTGSVTAPDEEILSFPIEVSDDWYMIKVIPQKALTYSSGVPVNNKVALSVTYVPSWLSSPDHLMINGNDTEPSWTELSPSASDLFEVTSERIIITQIEKP